MPSTAATLKFPPWAPDLNDIGTNTSTEILNVVARADGYGPFHALEDFTQPLPGICRGYFFARRGDGSIAVFASTDTDLYLLNNSNFDWDKVSQGLAPYTAIPSNAQWVFAQFNDMVIATMVNTPPQKFMLSSSAEFEDLGGTPPSAAFVNIVGFFVVLTGLLSTPRRMQWSDLGAPETWTAGVGLSDFQDMSDGGNVGAMSGGDAFGIVFQQGSMRSVTYAPGSATVFQIARISTQEALYSDYSIINVGDRTFYISAAGFKMIVGSGAPQAIGKERVDRWFFKMVDESALHLVIGANDPTATRVYWTLKSKQGADDQYDHVLCYDYVLNEWMPLKISGQYLASLAKPGLTLEQLDAIAPGAIQVLGAANNGVGLIRLTLNETSNQYFDIANQNFIVVRDVEGTVEANGQWVVNIIDATHIDLVGSAFVNAYTGGGAIGGSLDALPFSLDSINKASVAQLSGVSPGNAIGFFTGPYLEAIIETAEGDPQGRTVEVNGVRPITDCATAYCSLGSRMSPSAAVIYSDEAVVDDQGWSPQMIESRYVRGRTRMPAGADWTFATGMQPDIGLAGEA